MYSKNTQFDLVVVGEAAVDVLQDYETIVRRPGGVFYSALAASACGLRVGIIGGTSETHKNEFAAEIESLGVDISGIQPDSDNCIEYNIKNIDEIMPQVIINKISQKIFPSEYPIEFNKTKSVLIYPNENIEFLISIASSVKSNNGLVCLDLQHDQSSLTPIIELLSKVEIVFASRPELLQITETQNDAEALEKLWNENIKMVIVKYGMGGSIIYQPDKPSIQIPAYLANFKCTIGAGDTYNAVFIASLLENDELQEAGMKASLTATVFSEKINFPDYCNVQKSLIFEREIARRQSISAHPEQLSLVKIYIAGNFLSSPMKIWVDTITSILESRGFTVFSPYRDVGLLSSSSLDDEKLEYFQRDVEGIENSHLLVALLDSPGRGGTHWEIGYAFSKGIPVFGLSTDISIPISNMVLNSCKTLSSNPKSLLNEIFKYLAENEHPLITDYP